MLLSAITSIFICVTKLPSLSARLCSTQFKKKILKIGLHMKSAISFFHPGEKLPTFKVNVKQRDKPLIEA